jgi:DNA-binding response OmpR family regulator
VTLKPKILIVEDEDKAVKILQKFQTDFKYDVVGTVSTLESAIEAPIATSPGIVVINIHLNGSMDSIDAALSLRVQYGTGIVFISN